MAAVSASSWVAAPADHRAAPPGAGGRSSPCGGAASRCRRTPARARSRAAPPRNPPPDRRWPGRGARRPRTSGRTACPAARASGHRVGLRSPGRRGARPRSPRGRRGTGSCPSPSRAASRRSPSERGMARTSRSGQDPARVGHDPAAAAVEHARPGCWAAGSPGAPALSARGPLHGAAARREPARGRQLDRDVLADRVGGLEHALAVAWRCRRPPRGRDPGARRRSARRSWPCRG